MTAQLKPVPKFDPAAFAAPIHQPDPGTFAAAPLAPAPPPTLADFEQYRITATTDIPEPEPVITIAGQTIAEPGNIVTISGESKSGKSALLGIVIAGSISTTGTIVDPFEGLQVAPNTSGKAVIHIDTEQARHKQKGNIWAIQRRAGMDEQSVPPNFLSYNIRELALNEYQAKTEGICMAAADQFGGIHLMIVDGIADYITDANSIEQSDEIVRFFTALAIRYNMVVCTVVHTNPNAGITSPKERGHLGSTLQRKCQSVLRVIYDKSGDYSYLEPAFLRDAGRGQVPQIMFKYDPGKKYHVATGVKTGEDKEERKRARERTEAKRIAEKVFAPPVALRYNEAKKKIMAEAVCSDSTAKRKIEFMEEWGYITKGPDDHYRLAFDN